MRKAGHWAELRKADNSHGSHSVVIDGDESKKTYISSYSPDDRFNVTIFEVHDLGYAVHTIRLTNEVVYTNRSDRFGTQLTLRRQVKC
jgi:hypothetical protein